ncbi:cytochrome P450 [Phaeosphaeriaceae sp. PMI808]|nr:cytochrome P450 [Phaeosphaeriaceae sp. PMI808]
MSNKFSVFGFVSKELYSYTAISILATIILSFRYIAARNAFARPNKRDDTERRPPTEPYFFPLIGSLPLGYIFRPYAFVLDPKTFFGRSHPVRVKILTYEFYIVQGAENIKTLFKRSWACSSVPFVKFALGYAFGLHSKALALYDKDDSGGSQTPHPGSTVEARNRIDYLVYHSLGRLLEGKGLTPFWNRFSGDITTRLHDLQSRLSSNWENQPDLMRFVGDEATSSMVNALCGPHLLRLNPTFLRDYWVFDRNLQTYLQGIPWIFAPRAYASRKRVLNAVKTWQKHAREHYTDSALDANGDDPFWGSSFFRDRQKMFLEMDGFDHDAIASEDFGAVWAARNSIVTTSWVTYEIFRDPEILAKVRSEVELCRKPSVNGQVQFDIDELLRQPVLQAVYAETLRLKMHFYIIRMPDKIDMNIRDWIIPRQKVVITCTTSAHMDAKVWNTGSNSEHPVNEFWIGRFLKESMSGSTATTFSTKELEGSWIPYGGGPRQCPGRHFAKRQILLTTALLVTLFDCEILEAGKDAKEDLSLMGFGSGISLAATKIPVKVRRREMQTI